MDGPYVPSLPATNAKRLGKGAKRRSNPYFLCSGMDCFAALAMTAVGGSGLRQPVLRGVIGMAGDSAAMEGFAVTGHRREAALL
jgi:hypothetical protein